MRIKYFFQLQVIIETPLDMVRTIVDDDNLHILVTYLIVLPKYFIKRLVSVPLLLDDNIFLKIINQEYLVSKSEFDLIETYEINDLTDCTINQNKYYCQSSSMIDSVNLHDKIYIGPVVQITIQGYYIERLYNGGIMYVLPNEMTSQLMCNNEIKSFIDLSGIGILELNENCSLTIGNRILYSFTRYDNEIDTELNKVFREFDIYFNFEYTEAKSAIVLKDFYMTNKEMLKELFKKKIFENIPEDNDLTLIIVGYSLLLTLAVIFSITSVIAFVKISKNNRKISNLRDESIIDTEINNSKELSSLNEDQISVGEKYREYVEMKQNIQYSF